MTDQYLKLAANPQAFSPVAQARIVERARQRALNKVEEREHLRLELKARQYIQVCHECIDILRAGVELPGVGAVPGAPGVPAGTPLDRGRVQSLKAAMDGSLRLLDRVLPPLKAVEVSDSPERQADVARMTTADLMRLVMKTQSIPGEVVEEEVVEEEVVEEEVEEIVEVEKPPWE